MNKKLMAVFASVSIILSQYSYAGNAAVKNNTINTPSLAIIDTGLDTSLPIFSGKVIHEVCLIGWSTCPNGSGYQEGAGSSVVDPKFISTSEFAHGTQMASIAVNTNSNMNIVFIRIVGHTADGRRQIVPDSTIESALNWVATNKDKYNIKAVSMAQGSMSRHSKSLDYCPKISTVDSAVNKLSALGVPAFFSAGNNFNYKQINWPACIPTAIAVSATDQRGGINNYTNYDKALTDIFALGETNASFPGGKISRASGTSVSVTIAAANWVKLATSKPLLSYSELYSLVLKTAGETKGSKISSTKSRFDIEQALNG
jgi:hypothetical protein